MSKLGSRIGWVVAVVGMLLWSQPAHAYISDDDACGSAPAGWNAPNGAAVSSKSINGTISKLMDAIGEYYSHQMLSHGPGSSKWISHATMKTPGVSVGIFGDDHVDTDDLIWGYPGPAQVNMGAGYKMLYRADGSTVARYADGGSTGAQVADWMWYTLPYCGNVSSGVCYVGVGSQEGSGTVYIIGRKQNGVTYRHSYGFYQYQDDKSVPNGSDTSSVGWGQHCSTFMAWALNIVTGQTMSSKTYSSSVVSPATYALHDSLEEECDDGAGWFGGLFVNCGDIADQVVNCFLAEIHGQNICDNDSSSVWKGFANNNPTATSISPDAVVGNNGQFGGPWSSTPEYTLYWNNGGSVYGCFF